MAKTLNGVEVMINSKLEPLDDRIGMMESKMVEMQSKIAQGSSSSSAGGGGTGQAPRTDNLSRQSPFIPRFIEIKGYVINFDNREGMFEDNEAELHIRAIQQLLAAEFQQHFDMKMTMNFMGRVNFGKLILRFKEGEDAPSLKMCWKIKDEVAHVCKEYKINGKTVVVRLQSAPEKKALHVAAANAFGYLEKLGVPRDACRPEWGPPLVIFHRINSGCRWKELAKC